MTITYNEKLSATQGAWRGQHRAHMPLDESRRDVEIAQRRYTGGWLSEDEVLQLAEAADSD
jgi:hypothetical protein